MGGNVFKDNDMVRLDREDYKAFCKKVHKIFSISVEGVIPRDRPLYNFTRSYHSKQSFGDCDIVVEREFRTLVGDDLLKEKLHAQAYSVNGDVVSYKVPVDPTNPITEYFQLDVIYVDSGNYWFSLSYFNYNDLGSLIGVIAKQFGLKLGHTGLILPVYDGGEFVRDIVVTTNWDMALTFLGYDSFETNVYGFNDLDEIFKFVTSSIYFNKDYFLMKNRNHDARKRYSKRATYRAFLEWLESGVSASINKPSIIPVTPLDEVFHSFPSAERFYKMTLGIHRNKKLFRRVFNGDLISQVTGVKPSPELGKLVNHINAHCMRNSQRMKVFAETASNEDIKEFIMNAFDWYDPSTHKEESSHDQITQSSITKTSH